VERVSVDRIVIGGDVVPGPLPVETSSDHGRSATGPCFVRGNGDRWVGDTFDTPRSMSEGDERPGRPWAAWTADAIDRRDRDLLASFAGRDTAAWALVSKHQCGSRDREDAIPTTRRRARAPMCELIVPVKDGCQWPSVSPQRRSRLSPLAATFSPHPWPCFSPLELCARISEAKAVGRSEADLGGAGAIRPGAPPPCRLSPGRAGRTPSRR
jgi:hypothetical protein